MPRTIENDVLIHLVRQHHDVGATRQFGQRGQIVGIEQAACRVVRRVDDDHARARGNQRAHLIPVRFVIREIEWRINRLAADRFDCRDVTVVDRFENEHLVTAAHEGGNRREDGLRSAGGHRDFLFGVVARAVQGLDLVGDSHTQFGHSGHRRVLVSSLAHGTQRRFEERWFGLKIGKSL